MILALIDRNRKYILWLFWIYVIVIFIIAVIPGQVPLGSENDKINHLLAFFVFMILACLSYGKTNPVFLILAGLLYGILIEIVQLFVPFRTFSYLDIASDLAGLALGWLVRILARHTINKTSTLH
jgi:VanZ family protein